MSSKLLISGTSSRKASPPLLTKRESFSFWSIKLNILSFANLLICSHSIEFFKKFCILIPLPTSANNHQFYNAVEFKRTNNCEIINQSNINNDKLVKIIKFNLFEKKIKKIQQQRKTKKVSLVNIINDMLK